MYDGQYVYLICPNPIDDPMGRSITSRMSGAPYSGTMRPDCGNVAICEVRASHGLLLPLANFPDNAP